MALLTVDTTRAWNLVERQEGTFHYQFWLLEQEQALSYKKGSQLLDKKKGDILGGYVIESALQEVTHEGKRKVEVVGWVPSRIGNVQEQESGTFYIFYYHVKKGSDKASYKRGEKLRNQADDGFITNGLIIEMSYEGDPLSYWDIITVKGWVPWEIWAVEDREDGVYYTQTYRLAKDADRSAYERGSPLKNRAGENISDGIIIQMNVKDEYTWDILTVKGWVPWEKWFQEDLPSGMYYHQTYRLVKDANLALYKRGLQLTDRNGTDIQDGLIVRMNVEHEANWDIVRITGRVPRWR